MQTAKGPYVNSLAGSFSFGGVAVHFGIYLKVESCLTLPGA